MTDTSVFTLLTRGFATMRVDPSSAIPYFKRVLEIDSSNFQAHATLGYLYHSRGNLNDALTELSAADRLQPSDTLKLQIGYTLVSMHRDSAAYTIFDRLSTSPDPEIRKNSIDQLKYISAGGSAAATGSGKRNWTHIYSADYYDTRWESTFIMLNAEEGYNLTDILSFYGAFSLSADTRSSAGLVPEIFSDNSIMMGVGLRALLFTGFSVSLQEGAAFDIVGRTDIDFVRDDFRFFMTYGNGIYAPYMFHPDVKFPFYPILDVYTSLGSYSKYKNTIGYLQLKGGVRPLEVSKTVFDVYGKLNFARDWAVNILRDNASIKAKEYYNNIDEWGLGCRITPNVDWGVYLDAEYLRGVYSHADLLPADRDRYYNSFRFYIIIDRTF
jgi:tetratricopeptide (TPR) repeat protein